MAYQHKEAFCLMNYACRDCGHKEIVWNSRDGVTPFGISCPSCGSSSFLHTNFMLDSVEVNHKPHIGQIVFRDGTDDEAIAFTEMQYKERLNTETPMPEHVKDELIENIRNGQSSHYRKGWPMVTRHGFERKA